MRKICASVCLVAAALAGGPAFAADAHAVLRSSHLLPNHVAEDCGPMHDNNAVPSKKSQTPDSGQGRVERSPYGGNFCDSDSGVPSRADSQAHQSPSAPQSGQTGEHATSPDAPINPQAGYGGSAGSGTSGPSGS